MFYWAGNRVGYKCLLTRALNLQIERGSDREVATILMELSDINRLFDLHKEGIQQPTEALEVLERLGDTTGRVDYSIKLAYLLRDDGQLEATGGAASRALRPGGRRLIPGLRVSQHSR